MPTETSAPDWLVDVERRRYDLAHSFGLDEKVLLAYGRFVADLAPWNWFVTLTHDPRRLGSGHTIVGRSLHRHRAKRWLFDDVRRLDPSARWYSEMELTKRGQAHEHGLLSIGDYAPDLKMRQAWYERAGYSFWRPVTSREGIAAYAEAVYVCKYVGKRAVVEPLMAGFGLHRAASHSVSFGAAVR